MRTEVHSVWGVATGAAARVAVAGAASGGASVPSLWSAEAHSPRG